MAQAKSSSQEIGKVVKKLKAKPVFEKIVIQHLKNHFGTFEKHKDSSNRYWKVGNKVIRLYYYTDPRPEIFIASISKNVLKNIKNEGAYFVAANYCSKMKDVFTVYFIHPKTIQKHYLDADIRPRAGDNEWHIKIKHDNNNLIFYRKGAEEIIMPSDEENFYVDFTMSYKEYQTLIKVLPKERNSLTKKKATLKVVVAGDQDRVTFTRKSAIIIALLSVLGKSSKALKIEEILSKIVQYGVLTRASDNIEDIRSDLEGLVKTGAISVTKQRAYKMTDSIKVDVIL